MKTKKGEKEKLKLVILDKAVAFFKRHGRGGSGTDQIMKYMNLTRGALYSHFKSKDDLFASAISHDLTKLEESLKYRFATQGDSAVTKMIEDHLSQKNLTDVEASCVFTSLSSDMQRSKAVHRALFEEHMNRIYALFCDALQKEFPDDSKKLLMEKSVNLYSGLVGTLTMARTMKDPNKAKNILDSGKRFLISQFTKQ